MVCSKGGKWCKLLFRNFPDPALHFTVWGGGDGGKHYQQFHVSLSMNFWNFIGLGSLYCRTLKTFKAGTMSQSTGS